MKYPEALLHFAWKFKTYNQQALTLVGGEALEVIYPGIHNRNAGPDFLNARLKIAGTSWAGNVEIHRLSSEWSRHGHDRDPAYKNVLVHVVEQHDADIRDINGRILPTLELKGRLPAELFNRWEQMSMQRHPIPCRELGQPNALIARSWLDRMLSERMEARAERIYALLKQNRDNWQETFYQWFALAFGFHVNSQPFERLARSLPLQILLKYTQSRFQLEALLFGQAGFLNEHTEEAYPQSLQNEYQFLKNKYQLRPLDAHIWKFLRMRPANFPTVRIAQLAACMAVFPGLLQSLVDGEEIPDFTLAQVAPYWETHYHFKRASQRSSAHLGKTSANILLNNVIAPFLLVYGRHTGQSDLVEKALDIFSKTKPEHNRITLLFKDFFPEELNGGDTQALLHLKENYCDQLRCTDCQIGQYLLSK